MSIWIPPDSDFALALREPNLLVPGKKPVGAESVVATDDANGFVLVEGVNSSYNAVLRKVAQASDPSRFAEVTHSNIGAGLKRSTSISSAYVPFETRGFSGGEYTLIASIYFDTGGVIQSLLDDDPYPTYRHFQFRIAVDNKLEAIVWNTVGALVSLKSASALSANQYYVVALRVRKSGANTEIKSYLNFSTASTTLTGIAIDPHTTNIRIFARNEAESFDQPFLNPIFWVKSYNRALSDTEIYRHVEGHIGLRPANTTPYLFPVAAGGVTGAGDLVGPGSDIAGSGIRTVSGAGDLVAQGSTVSGIGIREITGAGALVGTGSEIAGAGDTGAVHAGTGDLIGQGSQITGTGVRAVKGTGALVAQGSQITGAGIRAIIGSGDLVGAGSDITGAGASGSVTTGTGDLVGSGSQIVGAGERTVIGAGDLIAQGSIIAGTGIRAITGAGALVGQGSQITGAGQEPDTVTGVGALTGAGSQIVGTGKRIIMGAGDLVAAGSIIVGIGERTVTGSGALVGAGSAVTGSAAHEFVAGNSRVWRLSARDRVWALAPRGRVLTIGGNC